MRTTPAEKIKRYERAGWWGRETLNSIFSGALSDAPDQLALADPPNRADLVAGDIRRLSYRDLDRAADRLARAFYEAGLRQDDKILVQLPNVAEIVIAYLAAARIGLILSPVAMQYGQFELAHIRDVITPSAYIAFKSFRGESFGPDHAGIMGADCRALFIEDLDIFGSDAKDCGGYDAYRDGLVIDANDIFTICWTSGTTGRSKGVPRSYNHWLSSTKASEDSIRLAPHAVMLNPFPFINMAAIGGFLFYWLKLRATLILHHPFDPMVYLSQLQNEKAEYTIAPPAVLNRLLQTKDQIKAGFDLSHLRIIGSGSAPLSPHMIEGFDTEFGIDVVNIFGSNEGMAFLSGANDVPDARERALYFPRFGRPEFSWDNGVARQITSKLVDLETGAEITDAGRAGELLLTGATVFDGYYNSPEDNAQAFDADGFFRSGDMFEITGDRNQFYKFSGRCKNLIVRGGVNISPEELDELLESHPDIAEAAVAAYPDDIMGEKICAVVSLLPDKALTLDDLTAYFADRKVAKFKWPEKLLIMDALPRNAMNKVVRPELEKLIR